ncbi:MAG: hypothetical protein QW133_06435 [Sulfolobales archaeon]
MSVDVFEPPTIRFRVFKEGDGTLIVSGFQDDKSVLIVKVERLKRKVKLFMRVVGSDEVFRSECSYDGLNECVGEFASRALSSSKYAAVINELVNALLRIIGNWDEYVSISDLVNTEFKPIVSEPIIESALPDGTIIRVLESDGVYMPLYGGFLSIDGCFAISEITPTYISIEKADSNIEKIAVVGILVEYDRSLNAVKAMWYYPQIMPTIRTCGRLVRVKTPSNVNFTVSTYPDIKTLKAVYESVGKGVNVSWVDVGAEIIKHVKEYIHHDDERVYAVIASYAVMTYFYDVFTAVPYIWFYGPPGSGKTRANITVTLLSRHGLVVEDATAASLFRLADAVGPTLGVDESKLDVQSKRIIAAGYKRGMVVPRAEPSKSGITLTLFEAMAPRVFSFIDQPEEDYLKQRTVMINMLKARPMKSEDPTPLEFKEIREKLYMLRLLDLGNVLRAKNEAEEILNKNDVWGRDKEIWWPILTAAILIGVKEQVLNFILEDIAKKRENIYTEEHAVLAAIEETFSVVRDVTGSKTVEAHFRASTLQDIIIKSELDQQGCIEVVTDHENIERTVIKDGCRKVEEELKKKWSVQRIGRILQRLGFDKYKKWVGKSANSRPEYHIKLSEFMDIAKRYGYTLTRDDLKSEESEESEKLLGGIQEKNSNENSRVEIFPDTPSTTLQTLQTFQTTDGSRMGRSEESEGLNNSSDLTLQTSQKCLKFEEFFMRYSPKEFDTLRKEGRVEVREVGGDVFICFK